MPNYQKMYALLFNEISRAISMLQEAQCKAEELFLAEEEQPRLIVKKQNEEQPP